MPEAVHIDWQPIGDRRASEAIYEQLRELITSGALRPGDRLPSERAMMEQLHRSRPTIREALRMLEQGGYVASTHGASGAVVQELTIDGVEQPLTAMLRLNQISLEELGEYRAVNDGTIAGWAALRRSEEDLADMEMPEIREIARAHGWTPAAVCLKWAVQRGQLPIPFSVHHYEENLAAVVGEGLTDDEMRVLAGLERGNRLVKGQVFLWPGARDWHDLWDEDGTIVDCTDC